jgi:hypothetical protein
MRTEAAEDAGAARLDRGGQASSQVRDPSMIFPAHAVAAVNGSAREQIAPAFHGES